MTEGMPRTAATARGGQKDGGYQSPLTCLILDGVGSEFKGSALILSVAEAGLTNGDRDEEVD